MKKETLLGEEDICRSVFRKDHSKGVFVQNKRTWVSMHPRRACHVWTRIQPVWVTMLEQLSLTAIATESQVLRAMTHKRRHCSERPVYCNEE